MNYSSYGANELKAVYQRNLIYAYVIVACLVLLTALYIQNFIKKPSVKVIPVCLEDEILSLIPTHSPPQLIIRVISESSNLDEKYKVILGKPEPKRFKHFRGLI